MLATPRARGDIIPFGVKRGRELMSRVAGLRCYPSSMAGAWGVDFGLAKDVRGSNLGDARLTSASHAQVGMGTSGRPLDLGVVVHASRGFL